MVNNQFHVGCVVICMWWGHFNWICLPLFTVIRTRANYSQLSAACGLNWYSSQTVQFLAEWTMEAIYIHQALAPVLVSPWIVSPLPPAAVSHTETNECPSPLCQNLLLGIFNTNAAHIRILGFYALFDSAIYGSRNTSRAPLLCPRWTTVEQRKRPAGCGRSNLEAREFYWRLVK